MNTPKEFNRVFLVADLSGYTALTEAHGNISAAKIVKRYFEIVKAILDDKAQLVDKVGDEVLVASENAGHGIQIAVMLRDQIEEEPNFPNVHIGIHTGCVVEQDGQYIGSALNIASRVAAYARAGQILCTEDVIELISKKDSYRYRSLGKINFRNVIEPLSIFEIIDNLEKYENNVTDPVCRMLVKPDAAPAKLPFQGQTYYFCSFECVKAFAENPLVYIPQ